jgi:uncharacterized protein YciI
MVTRRQALRTALLASPLFASSSVAAQAEPAASPVSLFAVEFRVGPKWDASKKPHEQAHFREHSANLKRLRDSGQLLVGARYSDKGFLVLAAESEASVRALVEADPAVSGQIFAYEAHPFNVFYAGCVPAPKRSSGS